MQTPATQRAHSDVKIPLSAVQSESTFPEQGGNSPDSRDSDAELTVTSIPTILMLLMTPMGRPLGRSPAQF